MPIAKTDHPTFIRAPEKGGWIALGFNGFAINGASCFDGLTNFFPASTYVSPYRVCLQ